jgi:DNA polymerase III epsilon subunit-like protein
MGAVLRHEDGTLEEVFNQLCKPSVDISDEAAAVHGITAEMVADKEPDSIAVKRLHQFVADNANDIILCGHNIVGFDMPILWRIGGSKPPVRFIDTLTCATRVFPTASSHKLSDLTQWLELGSTENAHDAMADIRMVFGLVDHVREGLMKPLTDLADWCMQPKVLSHAHFGKHKGKKWGYCPAGENPRDYVPSWYVNFICEKFDDPTPDMIATIRHHYRKRFKRI